MSDPAGPREFVTTHWSLVSAVKRGKRRFAELRRLDIHRDLAAKTAGSIHGPWRLSRSPALSYAFPNAHFDSLGLALWAKS